MNDSKIKLILYGINIVTPLVFIKLYHSILLLPTYLGPQFGETFTSFGSELPYLTNLFLKYPQYFQSVLIVILALYARFYLKIYKHGLTKFALIKVLLLNLGICIFAVVLFLVGMYLPAFTVGSVL